MLESLEGKRGQPRVKPPFPAVVGAFGCADRDQQRRDALQRRRTSSTRGADWFKAIGTDERNTGPKLYAISGHVERPGTYEYPIGVTFQRAARRLRRHVQGPRAEGVHPGRRLGADPHAGRARHQDGLRHPRQGRQHARLGGGDRDGRDHLHRARRRCGSRKFFAHESCGQCTPCREGTHWMRADPRADRAAGTAARPTSTCSPTSCPNVGGISLCALGDAAQGPVRSLVQQLPRRDRASTSATVATRCRERRYFDYGAAA